MTVAHKVSAAREPIGKKITILQYMRCIDVHLFF